MTSNPNNSKPLAVILGVGESTGSALAWSLAREFRLALVARSANIITSLAEELADTTAWQCDVSDLDQFVSTLSDIEASEGLPQVIIVNTEAGGFGHFTELDPKVFTASFATNVTPLLVLAQTLLPRITDHNLDLRVIINSSRAAYDGSAMFTGMGPSRAGQRMLAESLAEATKMTDVRFALLVIDGPIDEPRMRAWYPGKPDNFFIPVGHIVAKSREILEQDPARWTFRHDVTSGRRGPG